MYKSLIFRSLFPTTEFHPLWYKAFYICLQLLISQEFLLGFLLEWHWSYRFNDQFGKNWHLDIILEILKMLTIFWSGSYYLLLYSDLERVHNMLKVYQSVLAVLGFKPWFVWFHRELFYKVGHLLYARPCERCFIYTSSQYVQNLIHLLSPKFLSLELMFCSFF